ncbi:hypothetical protein M409DRAFT_71449 [Zasmidium cellare ATCC 36951]|uniref:Octanoyltransferase n=1 Tax=Zasmidium cellare ATCC 36951 TaxID=1080233 RepID=A0A6A6BVM0_ZASCE|nr:uncharacterized protein M409DRAFT_71449 [Zasmidium cellare ATCC 36951]KAF2158821.1 hypothetical protein M409DRAFT_71449 [Zasmidium cellare ATCC 36951]
MILRHLHLHGLTKYPHAAALQDRVVSRLLAHKANPTSTPAPPPTIITAQFHPVYTCGRREVSSVSSSQIEYLTQPTPFGQATFEPALRGGQTTFHGPGQLIAYPIIDLKRHNLRPRDYVCLLEKTVSGLCRNQYGVNTTTTSNPGVWVDEMHKICALGVHLRRNVTSHGIGLNVSTELGWFERIVACGLEGKFTTSLEREGVKDGELDMEAAADGFVRGFGERLEGVDGVARIGEREVD